MIGRTGGLDINMRRIRDNTTARFFLMHNNFMLRQNAVFSSMFAFPVKKMHYLIGIMFSVAVRIILHEVFQMMN